jgi:cell wall-associated NlpC family hydrolase
MIVFVSCSAFKEAPASATIIPSVKAPNKYTSGKPALSSKEELRLNIIELSKHFLGRRYRSGGKSPDTGFDCSGFTGFLFGTYNVRLSASSSSQIFDGNSKSINDLEPGDLVFFARSPGGRIFHVALVTNIDNNGIHVIHSTNTNGVIETNISKDGYWAPKLAGARDVIGN